MASAHYLNSIYSPSLSQDRVYLFLCPYIDHRSTDENILTIVLRMIVREEQIHTYMVEADGQLLADVNRIELYLFRSQYKNVGYTLTENSN